MTRYELTLISLVAWYFHPGNKDREWPHFLDECIEMATDIDNHLNAREHINSWQQSGQLASEPQDQSPEA